MIPWLHKMMSKPAYKVLVIFLAWKLLLTGVGYIGYYKAHEALPLTSQSHGITKVIEHTRHFDAEWYQGISQGSYATNPAAPAFYPLFPLLIAVVTALVRSELLAAFVINIIFGYLAFLFLYKLVKEYTKDSQTAYLGLLLFAFFPAAYFLHVMYTEALFCALSFMAFYFARKESWGRACLALMFLTAVRLPALLVAAAVALEYFASKGFKLKKIDRSAYFFLLVPLGWLSYAAYLQVIRHNPLAMFAAYAGSDWGYQHFTLNIFATIYQQIRSIWDSVVRPKAGAEIAFFNVIMPFLSWLLGVASLVYTYYKKLPISWVFYLATSLLLFILNGNFVSVGRYVLPLFPIYLFLLGALKAKSVSLRYPIWLATSAGVMMVMLLLFSLNVWTS